MILTFHDRVWISKGHFRLDTFRDFSPEQGELKGNIGESGKGTFKFPCPGDLARDTQADLGQLVSPWILCNLCEIFRGGPVCTRPHCFHRDRV